jgi:lipoprotein-releasing system permease protein
MLGVATLIVVNSVMSGFSTKLRDRLHGLCSDILIEAMSLDGFGDPDGKMEAIRKDPFLAAKIQAMTPTLEVYSLLQFSYHGQPITKVVRLIGVEPEGRTAIGGFKEFLVNQKKADKPSFAISEDAKRHWLWYQQRRLAPPLPPIPDFNDPDDQHPTVPVEVPVKEPRGIILGNLIASFRTEDLDNPGKYKDVYLLEPGDEIVVYTTSGVQARNGVYDNFVVVDYFKSDMSDYDQNCVFVPLDYLQHLLTRQDKVTSIQIKLKDYGDAEPVCDRLRALFPREKAFVQVVTWEDKQGPILAAIDIEKGILNVLLFLIIGVAGFGILAIFSMIVAEKTRDIGILKALGASNVGIMKIFLSYGFLLGLIGTLIGTGIGILLTTNINEVETVLSMVTGQKVFNPKIYYFNEIPTHIQPGMLVLVNCGAVAIAVVFSVLPALRAATLHPVKALRYE